MAAAYGNGWEKICEDSDLWAACVDDTFGRGNVAWDRAEWLIGYSERRRNQS